MKGQRFYRAFVLTAFIAGTIAISVDAAAAQPGTEAEHAPIVLHGSASAADGGSGGNGPGVVLRGTPPPVPPVMVYTCAPGYLPDPNSGCIAPPYAYAPNEIEYWPYAIAIGTRHHRFRHRVPGPGLTPRIAHREFRRR